MRYFFNKKKDAQGRYINPPVHAKRNKVKNIQVRSMTDAPVMSYKFDRGALKETTEEKRIRIAKESEARYYARQAEKEAKRLLAESKPLSETERALRARGQGTYKRTEAQRANMIRASKLRWKKEKNRGPTSVVGLTTEEAREKRNAYQNARNARLRAEAKNKSTAFVITITITDPNKS